MISTSPIRHGPIALHGSPLTLAGNLLLAATAMGASTQSIQLQQHLCDLQVYYALPAINHRDRRRERFGFLAQQWRRDTECLSSTTDIAMHPAYQAIIGMGKEALPLILADLEKHSGHWYWALKSISNEDPVPPRDRGAIKKMRAAWLQWGRAKGLLTA